MHTQPAYQTEPLTLTFEATITHQTELPAGGAEVRLAESYFYPTGGGQPHDTGTLGPARVVDVFKNEQGQVLLRLDRPVTGDRLPASINAGRRRSHMQHHSAQHILSQALHTALGLETLSAKISADSPSTIDTPYAEVDWPALHKVERLANQLIFENRLIKTYVVSEAELATIPLRRPPKVSGRIRIVEVEGFDYSACGGTHCPAAGMIGAIKIVKSERQNKKLRFYFVAGEQALATFQSEHQILSEVCAELSTGPAQVAALVQQHAEQLKAAQKMVQTQLADLLALEAGQLAAEAVQVGHYRLAARLFEQRSGGELRLLADRLSQQPECVAVLAGYNPPKLSVVVGCGAAVETPATELLSRLLKPIGGRGGGDSRLAQGGGEATEEQAATLLALLSEDAPAGRLKDALGL